MNGSEQKSDFMPGAAARFTRISEAQYRKDLGDRTDPLPLSEIPLPRRSTRGSAGYDFTATVRTEIPSGESRMIPTGIRCEMMEGWVLLIFPRSSFGIRHGVRLSNTVGVIDGDYAFAANEGHIMVPLRNPSDHTVVIERGERFCQGVLIPFGRAEEEEIPGKRSGGFGSTGR